MGKKNESAAAAPAGTDAADAPNPSTAPELVSDGQLVHLCDSSRKELFMLETPNTTTGTCDRCDATGTMLYQYPRAEVRMEHLAATDRNAFNAKLDALAAAAVAAQQLQDAQDAAAAKRAQDAQDALVAANDALYQAAVANRRAIEAAESGTPPAIFGSSIIQSPATPATPSA